ncbi:MAG: lamin tail domain-containing protein [Candidatus Marinimicrobia bacterium]|nr:lamin tail domain-containing protein [Candidatus Neomarinimicrobiota bacterium]
MKISYKEHKLKKLLIILLLFTLFCCNDKNNDILNETEADELVINEFLAKNNACCPDEFGEFDDWVEIYNGNDEPVNIGGMYFSDRRDDPDPYGIPNTDASLTTIPAGGFLVLWCDGQIEQGLLHLDLKLSGDGESVVLIDKDGTTILDSYTFAAQTTDVSMGRSGSDWVSFEYPTPGTTNN